MKVAIEIFFLVLSIVPPIEQRYKEPPATVPPNFNTLLIPSFYTYGPMRWSYFPWDRLNEAIPIVEKRSSSKSIVFQRTNEDYDYTWDDADPYYDLVVFLRVDGVSKDAENLRNNKKNDKNDSPEGKIISTGVFITVNHVLTSFNPFRKLLPILRSYDIVVATLRNRYIVNNNYARVTHLRATCARQVIPLMESEVPENAWHGLEEHRQTALHDLMVARVAGTMRFKNIENQPLPPTNFRDPLTVVFNKTSIELFETHRPLSYFETPHGPLLTEPATPDHRIEEVAELRFASIAFMDDDHIKENSELRTKTFSADAQVDCSEFLFREWGEFICIKDDDNYPGIGSGATLTALNRVYGIGSFKVEKGNTSVFVFTDVRKYHHLLNHTCTTEDHPNILDEFDYNYEEVTVNVAKMRNISVNKTQVPYKPISDRFKTWYSIYTL